ncbi:PEP-CTERM sorting domain-containing protein [Thalassotalea euphylliae]|uniref:PEP-CTERM sorting domain-containing protein n=1 Tax=Thalassotalea euphylliae TaxID=1655234 RepID=A0A3E0UJI8_9GAMM|nr:PEP-CTERM sorting domain-containing protein [Thalassotalea euphylliae]REL37060.1 PEP-CTERM sorting domain-containing protein [Thalassotalea euphylliae]
MKKLSKSVLAIASAVALSASFSGSALADSYAFANLNINNLVMSDGNGNPLTTSFIDPASGNIQLPNGVNDTQVNNANLGGVFTQETGTPDSAMACIGDCAIGGNTFTQVPLGTNFSRSDSLITGAVVDIDGAGAGATANSVAETQLTTNTTSNSQSTVATNTQFFFNLNQASQVQFDFTASGLVEAEQTPDNNVPPSFAQASTAFSIVIREVATNAIVFSWAPDGFVGVNATTTELQDDMAINLTLAATSAGQVASQAIMGSFSAVSTNALLAGVNYTLSINHQTNVVATRDVPEPGMLFALALGLMGFAARKKLQS